MFLDLLFLLANKNEIWDSLYFQVLPGHFYFARGHSLVELTEQDSSAVDIMAHGVYIYVLLHS